MASDFFSGAFEEEAFFRGKVFREVGLFRGGGFERRNSVEGGFLEWVSWRGMTRRSGCGAGGDAC